MDNYRNNTVTLASTAARRSSYAAGSASSVPSGGARRAAAGASAGRRSSRASAGARSGRAGSGRPFAAASASAERSPRDGGFAAARDGEGFVSRSDTGAAGRSRARAAHPGDRAGEGASSPRRERSTNFMKYAADSRVVQMLYAFMTGRTKPLFYALVIGAVAVGLYFPVRDCYAAWRTGDILSRQYEVRKAYNDSLQAEVDKYLSQEGIEQSARELGMVLPGETRVEVTGDGSSDASSGDDSSDVPSSSAEAAQAEQAVAEEAPWYIKALDALFFFDAGGQSAASGQ